MKIAFNRQPRRSPWGGGAHFATTFADYLVAQGHEVVYSLQPGLDWIIMLDPRYEDGGFAANDIAIYKAKHPHVKMLHRINDTGVTRGGEALDNLIIGANQLADRTVFISSWVKDHFGPRKRHPNDTDAVITNGCDERYFYPEGWTSTEWYKARSGSDGKIFYPPGFDKPHTPVRLVTHHWSNNPKKGVDLYEYIDELIDCGAKLEFTYVGRYPVGHIPKHAKIIAPLYGTALGDELRKHDVYVTAARHEACGSHHVEGAACGMPVIYHNEGGGVVEMCSRYGVGIDNVSEFNAALETIQKDYRSFYNLASNADLSAATMCKKYLELMT